MIYKNKEYKLFDTDYYQISMVYAFIMDDKANIQTGYEGFVRNIKTPINPKNTYYKFSGEKEVKEYIERIKIELQNPIIKEIFISLLSKKIKYDGWEEDFSRKFDNLITDFEYTVVKENSIVFPYIPVFQYRGPKWIGQMIETSITNIYNGKTGFNTIKDMKEKGVYISNTDIDYIESIVFDIGGTYYERYMKDLDIRAKEYKEADIDGFLIEAAFRRAPSKGIADIASKKALENNWIGTSNVSILNNMNENKINGTMAHAFVMSYKFEIDSFRVWNKYFPKSTILIDTYDTINAIKKLILNSEDISNFNEKIKDKTRNFDELKPNDVRIDSGNFYTIVPTIRKIMDQVGWNDVGIFISGDITPELLINLRNKNIPFTKSMAGTYYVYCNELVKKVNSGFVYKIVEYKDENNNFVYPEKKAIGKKNYTGIKNIIKIDDNTFKIINNFQENEKLDISMTNEFNENSKIIFDI
jgi:nicotinic acid phosphoribosyltransferase